jgi:hypothetical protein
MLLPADQSEHRSREYSVAFVRPWLEEIPGRIEGDESPAIADDDGLFTCAGCARRVYVPTASMN